MGFVNILKKVKPIPKWENISLNEQKERKTTLASISNSKSDQYSRWQSLDKHQNDFSEVTGGSGRE